MINVGLAQAHPNFSQQCVYCRYLLIPLSVLLIGAVCCLASNQCCSAHNNVLLKSWNESQNDFHILLLTKEAFGCTKVLSHRLSTNFTVSITNSSNFTVTFPVVLLDSSSVGAYKIKVHIVT